MGRRRDAEIVSEFFKNILEGRRRGDPLWDTEGKAMGLARSVVGIWPMMRTLTASNGVWQKALKISSNGG